jgi:uncharacterized membrane protein
MIDQPGHGWLVVAALVLASFAAGGWLAGRSVAGEARSAVEAGAASGGVAAAALVAADIVRRLALTHQQLTLPVARLWIDGAVAAVVVSALGGFAGQRPWRSERRGAHAGDDRGSRPS